MAKSTDTAVSVIAAVVALAMMLLVFGYFSGTFANLEGNVAEGADSYLYDTGLYNFSSIANPINNFLAWLGILLTPSTVTQLPSNPVAVMTSLGATPPANIQPYFGGLTSGIDQTNTENANPNG